MLVQVLGCHPNSGASDYAHAAQEINKTSVRVPVEDGKAQIGTFADAASFGELVFDCTNGASSLAALRQASPTNLRGKILIQVGNPLDSSAGMPPR